MSNKKQEPISIISAITRHSYFWPAVLLISFLISMIKQSREGYADIWYTLWDTFNILIWPGILTMVILGFLTLLKKKVGYHSFTYTYFIIWIILSVMHLV